MSADQDTPAPAAEPALCPCGSGDELAQCCGPLLRDARPAPTAPQLMRSRYTAYALGDLEHLLSTWHPRTRPDRAELASSLAEGLVWRRLVIHETRAGGPFAEEGEEAMVEFTALARTPEGQRVRMRERSRFVRRDGQWLYVDGETP